MTKKIGLEIDIKSTSVGEANERMETAQQELRRLKKELTSGELQGEAFDAAAARAGELRDRIGDVNQRINVLASDSRKLDAFVSVAQGVAGGFAAAQGAAALFGSENENLQKTFVKLQAAMATLQGVQALANTLNKDSAASTILLGRAKQALAGAIGTATGAAKAFRVAMIATGIGAITVAVGLLVANWDKFTAAVLRLIPGLETLGKFLKSITQQFTDFIGITSEAARQADALRLASDKNIKAGKAEIEVMKARGATARELYEAENKLIYQRIHDLNKLREINGKLTKEELEERQNLIQQLRVLEAGEKKRLEDEAAKAKADRAKKAAERKAEQEKAAKEELERLDKEAKARLDARRKEEAELDRIVKESLKEREEWTKNFFQNENTIVKASKLPWEERQEAIDMLNDALVSSAIDSLASLSGLFEQGSRAQKAFALASIAADTGAGIARGLAIAQQGAAGKGPLAPYAFPIFYANQLAAVLGAASRARSVLKGGSVQAAPSMGSRVSSVPMNAPQPQQQVGGIRVQQQQRVFVLESDISRTQRRVNVIERNGVID
jgi:hypothetical protein